MWRSKRFSVTLREMLASQALQHLEILVAHFGGHLEAHMQQLAQIRIEARILLIVAQRGGVLFGTPSVDDGRVRAASRNRYRSPSRRARTARPGSQKPWRKPASPDPDPSPPASARPINSSSQVVPAVLRWTPAPNLSQRAADGRVDRKLVAAGMHAQLEIRRAGRTVAMAKAITARSSLNSFSNCTTSPT